MSIGDELKFNVFFNHDNLDIVWSDVSSFNHSSHGILGKCLLVHQTSTSHLVTPWSVLTFRSVLQQGN